MCIFKETWLSYATLNSKQKKKKNNMYNKSQVSENVCVSG